VELVRFSNKYLAGLYLLFVSANTWLTGCNQGVGPEPLPQYGISGVVKFRNWPPRDSVVDLRLVAFKNFSSQNIIAQLLAGEARFTDSLKPYGAASIHYTLLLSPLQPGNLSYIAVAQRFGASLFADWRAVGVFYRSGDTTHPGSVFVPANAVVPGINIDVDFSNPPPQQF